RRARFGLSRFRASDPLLGMRDAWGDEVACVRRAILATLVGLAACVDRPADEPMTGSGSGSGSESGSASDGGAGGIACAPLLDGCAPFDAEGVGDCAQVLGWAWDGADCVPVEGCACEGEQCCHL